MQGCKLSIQQHLGAKKNLDYDRSMLAGHLTFK